MTLNSVASGAEGDRQLTAVQTQAIQSATANENSQLNVNLLQNQRLQEFNRKTVTGVVAQSVTTQLATQTFMSNADFNNAVENQ